MLFFTLSVFRLNQLICEKIAIFAAEGVKYHFVSKHTWKLVRLEESSILAFKKLICSFCTTRGKMKLLHSEILLSHSRYLVTFQMLLLIMRTLLPWDAVFQWKSVTFEKRQQRSSNCPTQRHWPCLDLVALSQLIFNVQCCLLGAGSAFKTMEIMPGSLPSTLPFSLTKKILRCNLSLIWESTETAESQLRQPILNWDCWDLIEAAETQLRLYWEYAES